MNIEIKSNVIAEVKSLKVSVPRQVTNGMDLDCNGLAGFKELHAFYEVIPDKVR